MLYSLEGNGAGKIAGGLQRIVIVQPRAGLAVAQGTAFGQADAVKQAEPLCIGDFHNFSFRLIELAY